MMAALSGRDARLRAVVGKGAGMFVLMSRLPIRLCDRLMRSALGLSEALKPFISTLPGISQPGHIGDYSCVVTLSRWGRGLLPAPAQIPACAANAPGSMSMCSHIIGGRSSRSCPPVRTAVRIVNFSTFAEVLSQ
jgi:hypothetical protein